ncbi:hypothetical protein MMC13_002057 [Lambiella insularis]|nr:hypothetical protein [Lambiella insularis]
MAEAAGLTIGIVALASLFSTCVECWDYIDRGRSHGRDYEILATQLDIEKTRFLLWGQTIGLLDVDGVGRDSTLDSPSVEKTIERCLHNIHKIFTDSDALVNRYGMQELDPLTTTPMSSKVASSHSLQTFKESWTKFQARVKGVQRQSSFLRKTRWAIRDRAQFDLLLGDLRQLISGLKDITDSRSNQQLQQRALMEELESLPLEDLIRVKEATRGLHDDISDAATVVLEMSVMGDGDSEETYTNIEDWIPDPATNQAIDTLLKAARNASAEGYENLHWAVENGHKDVVLYLLDMGADIEAKNPANNDTPLMRAVQIGNADVAEALLERGARIDGCRSGGVTGLFTAVQWQHANVIRLLLRYGANINAHLDENGATPLIEAVRHGYERSVQDLLEAGADVEARDHGQWTALVWAARVGRVHPLELLLKHGADINARADSGASPLRRAAMHGRTAIAELLIERGANLEAAIPNESTPLLEAAWYGHVNTTRMLLTRGSNIEAADEDGRTSLSRSALQGQTEMIRLLLEHKANIEAQDKEGYTPLMWAASGSKDRLEATEALLQAGASLRARNKHGATALSEAAWHNQDGVLVQCLLDHGGDLEAEDNDSRTPLYRAVQQRNTAVVQILLARKANTEKRRNGSTPDTPLLLAVWFSDREEIIKLLLDHNAAIEARDGSGRTALIRAAREGHTRNVELLLSKGASIEARDCDGGTALMRACDQGHKPMLLLLIRTFANERARDCFGRTILHAAVKNGRSSLVKEIIRMGVDIDACGRNGEPALWDAVKIGNAEIVRLLLDSGANVMIKTKSGETPFLLAARKGDERIMELFS